jgi:D-glycero-D-manno-heptose 1,7-bisphosphate phosphatase
MSYRAVFLDRDGTINHDPGYIKDPKDVIILPGVSEGIRKLKGEFGFKIIVISNQAGIAKGLMTYHDVQAVNLRITELLKKEGAIIDGIYFCPFHPDINSEEESRCRKPSPEMIYVAVKEHDIDLSGSFIVGDRHSDIECGINAGIKTILMKSDWYEETISSLHQQGKKPNFLAANFTEAYEFIVKVSGGNN